MNYPSSAPLSFPPNSNSNAPPPPPPQSSSVAPVLYYEQSVPTHRVPRQQCFTPSSHADTHSTTNHNGIPTAEHRTAITILQGFPIPEILAWVKDFLEQGSYPGNLSEQHCWAVSTLSDCFPIVVQKWLNDARSPSTINPSQNLYRNSNPSYGSVIANSSTQWSSCFSDPSIHLTPRSSCHQRPYEPSGDASIGSPSSSTAILSGHDRWCYLNKNHTRPYNDLDAFKRHVHDHHLQYHCIIPQELLVITKDGPKCVCGFANPDPGHFQEHNVLGCNGKRFTRKETLSKHLKKKHKFHDGSVLAGQSKHPVDQKYFACGFCVHRCESLNAQLNHIDRHYRDLKHISDWDDDKVIQGLLSQVDDYRRTFLAATPYLPLWSFTWHPTHAKNMRHRLEMGQEPAATLVQAAIQNSNYRTSQSGHVDSMLVTGSTDEETITCHSTREFHRGDGLSPRASTPEQCSLSHTPPTTAPTFQSQRLARDWVGTSNSGWPTNYEDRPSPQTASETYGSPANTIYGPADHPMRPDSSQKGDESSLQRQRPAYMPSNTSASYASQAMDSHARALDYSTPSRYSPGVSRDVAAHPVSRQVIELHPNSTQACVPPLAIQSTSSSQSPNHEISPLHQSNRAYRPYYQTAPVQFLDHETRACHGMDMGFDLDNQQRFLQDHNHSKHHRRRG